MKPVTMRPPIFVADLADALDTTEFEIQKTLIQLEVFVIPPGLLEDELAIKVAEKHNRALNLEKGDPIEIEQANAEHAKAGREFFRRFGRSGEGPE